MEDYRIKAPINEYNLQTPEGETISTFRIDQQIPFEKLQQYANEVGLQVKPAGDSIDS